MVQAGPPTRAADTPSASVYARPAEQAGGGAVGPAVPPPTAGDDAVDPADAAGRAERIVSACLAGLARQPSIAARMRQRVRVGDHSLVGSGIYLQAGLGEQQRFRFETTLTTDARSTVAAAEGFFTVEKLEICDGAVFWTYHHRGDLPAEVHRVDMARVRQRLEEITGIRDPDAVAITLHVGGVPRMLAWLREWFVFDRAESAEIDGMPVWLVEGRWNPAQLARMVPDKAEAIMSPAGISPERLPDGVPWSVRLSIGKRELFPFRVEYFAVPGQRPVADSRLQSVGVFELYDVQLGEPVDQTSFIYAPASETVIDTTVNHLGSMFGPRP